VNEVSGYVDEVTLGVAEGSVAAIFAIDVVSAAAAVNHIIALLAIERAPRSSPQPKSIVC